MAKLSARKNAVFLAISTLIAAVIAIASPPILIVEAYSNYEKKLDDYGVPWYIMRRKLMEKKSDFKGIRLLQLIKQMNFMICIK